MVRKRKVLPDWAQKILLGVLILIVLIPITYGGWHLKRWINWNLGYSGDVKEAVCEMVKLEYLKNPEDCK